MLGAGLVVYNQSADIADAALNAAGVFRNESCGKCVPCRLGSQKVVEVGQELLSGKMTEGQFGQARQLVDELAATMELTSICGLGVVAAKPLTSAAQFFPQDVAGHLAGTPSRKVTEPVR